MMFITYQNLLPNYLYKITLSGKRKKWEVAPSAEQAGSTSPVLKEKEWWGTINTK